MKNKNENAVGGFDNDTIKNSGVRRLRYAPDRNPYSSFGPEGLVELMFHVRNKLGVNLLGAEVGCCIGESTGLFLASKLFSRFFAVDRWEQRKAEAIRWIFNRRLSRFENLQVLNMYSEEGAKSIETLSGGKKLDFVYIDADHEYESIKNDIACWLPHIRKGGIISGHDYRKNFPGVIQAVHEAFGEHNATVFIDGSWLVELPE